MPVASMSIRLRIGGTQMFVSPGTFTARSSSSTSLSGVMPGAPLVARLELDRGLEHFQRRRIGRRFGASDLAKDTRDFGHRLDQSVGLLQELSHLSGGNTRQRRRHVKQIPLVEGRHELTADLASPATASRRAISTAAARVGPGRRSTASSSGR